MAIPAAVAIEYMKNKIKNNKKEMFYQERNTVNILPKVTTGVLLGGIIGFIVIVFPWIYGLVIAFSCKQDKFLQVITAFMFGPFYLLARVPMGTKTCK